MFLMTNVPRGSKMYRMSAGHEIHIALHFEGEGRVRAGYKGWSEAALKS